MFSDPLPSIVHDILYYFEQVCKGEDFQAWVEQTFAVQFEISLRPAGKKGFVVLPKRWIVERSFAHLARSRRLSKDYEKLADNSQGFVYLASIQRLLKHLVPVT